jgi:hypothetical protein
MADITLFPSGQQPMHFPDATAAHVDSGVLYFRSRKEPNKPAQSAFSTNLPFVMVEDD